MDHRSSNCWISAWKVCFSTVVSLMVKRGGGSWEGRDHSQLGPGVKSSAIEGLSRMAREDRCGKLSCWFIRSFPHRSLGEMGSEKWGLGWWCGPSMPRGRDMEHAGACGPLGFERGYGLVAAGRWATSRHFLMRVGKSWVVAGSRRKQVASMSAICWVRAAFSLVDMAWAWVARRRRR